MPVPAPGLLVRTRTNTPARPPILAARRPLPLENKVREQQPSLTPVQHPFARFAPYIDTQPPAQADEGPHIAHRRKVLDGRVENVSCMFCRPPADHACDEPHDCA